VFETLAVFGVSGVLRVPSVFGATSAFWEPSVFREPMVLRAPSILEGIRVFGGLVLFKVLSVFRAPSVFEGYTVFGALVLFRLPSVFRAPSVPEGVTVFGALVLFGVSTVFGALVLFGVSTVFGAFMVFGGQTQRSFRTMRLVPTLAPIKIATKLQIMPVSSMARIAKRYKNTKSVSEATQNSRISQTNNGSSHCEYQRNKLKGLVGGCSDVSKAVWNQAELKYRFYLARKVTLRGLYMSADKKRKFENMNDRLLLMRWLARLYHFRGRLESPWDPISKRNQV